jgi:hypothetical protein
MSKRARRFTFAVCAILVVALVVGLRVMAPPPLPASVPLSTGKYRVRFLKADVGKLNYSSDDQLRKFLRPRLPGVLARKLGDPITAGFTSGQNAIGEPPLVLLFQLLTTADTPQGTIETIFDRIEFPESTGFVFREEIRGYSSSGNGTSMHNVPAFPRRERDLHFRLYETGGRLLMERTIPNPGYRPNVPVWTPIALPQSKSVDEANVTLKSLLVREQHRFVKPEIEVQSNDSSWLNPVVSHQWPMRPAMSGDGCPPLSRPGRCT